MPHKGVFSIKVSYTNGLRRRAGFGSWELQGQCKVRCSVPKSREAVNCPAWSMARTSGIRQIVRTALQKRCQSEPWTGTMPRIRRALTRGAGDGCSHGNSFRLPQIAVHCTIMVVLSKTM